MADTKTLPQPTWPAGFQGQIGADAYTADQMRAYAAAALAAQAQGEPVKPLFAVAVARRKWDELQADGHRMQSIAFDGGKGGAGTIDPWGVVCWRTQPSAQPLTEAPF